MRQRRVTPADAVRWLLLGGAVLAAAAGCSAAGSPRPTAVTDASGPPVGSHGTDPGTTTGDVPDDAVFLTYSDPAHGFTVQYVEGWQVEPRPDGVSIRDKDSSETISMVSLPSDVAVFVTGSDLPALGRLPGFRFMSQDTATVNGTTVAHIVYDLPSPPDPVTGKAVPSVVDRYYVPGPSGLALVSLSTPVGVDNVDAFRQMIESFRWTR